MNINKIVEDYMRTEEEVADDLILFLLNNREFYKSYYKPMASAMAKKERDGKFDDSIALSALRRLISEGIKIYCKASEDVDIDTYTSSIKKIAATKLLQHIKNDIGDFLAVSTDPKDKMFVEKIKLCGAKGKEVSMDKVDVEAPKLEESNEVKHPDQDKLESDLMSVKNTEKVEFDYRPYDGVYKDPENHLIILVFNDGEFEGNGKDWFYNRRMWKKGVLAKLKENGWELEDPIEDDDTYLYLVLQRNVKTQPPFTINEGASDNYYSALISLDDAMASLVDNCDDSTIDSVIRTYTRVMKNFGKRHFSEVCVMLTDSGYDVESNKYLFGDKITKLSDISGGLKKYSLTTDAGDIVFIEEPSGSTTYLYFTSEEDGENYIEYIDKLQNGGSNVDFIENYCKKNNCKCVGRDSAGYCVENANGTIDRIYHKKDTLCEGTWSVPYTMEKCNRLAKILEREDLTVDIAEKELHDIVGNDHLYDDFFDVKTREDIVDAVINYLKVLVKDYEEHSMWYKDQFEDGVLDSLKNLIKKYAI